MITISKQLILPADQEDRRKKLTAQLKKHRPSLRTVYCVILPTTDGGILEVIPLYALRLEARDHDVTVLGVSEGKNPALELVESMIGEVYRETGGFDVRSYFLKE
ncbi:MAG: hypothetical protein J6S79_04135 [Lachnospiraceae bacterium]|nr:hypothetical protein [Lachnospiraceae bacterium]